MSRKRMIDPSIWQDEEFGELSATGKILFIGLFSNADDEGRIKANSAYLKSTIFMYDSISLEAVDKQLDMVAEKMKNVKVYTVDGKRYVQLLNWNEYQKQHKDRIQPSTLPAYTEDMSDNVGQVSDNVGVSKDKISKVKLSKDKIEREPSVEQSADYLLKIPFDHVFEISQKFKVSEDFVILKAEELKRYCEAHGKHYKNYRAFLENAVSRDALKQPKEREIIHL